MGGIIVLGIMVTLARHTMRVNLEGLEDTRADITRVIMEGLGATKEDIMEVRRREPSGDIREEDQGIMEVEGIMGAFKGDQKHGLVTVGYLRSNWRWLQS